MFYRKSRPSLLKKFLQKNAIFCFFVFLLSFFSNFASFSIFSCANYYNSDYYAPFIEADCFYGVNFQSEVSSFSLTDETTLSKLKKSFGNSLSYSCSYDENNRKNAFFDSFLPNGCGVVDHETYLELGCPKMLSVSNDFYTMNYQIEDNNAPRKGLYISAFYPEKNISCIRVLDGKGEETNPFITNATLFMRYSSALQEDIIDSSISLPPRTMICNSFFDKEGEISYAPLEIASQNEALRNKTIDFHALFPQGFHLKTMNFKEKSYSDYAIVSDADFNKIVHEANYYSSFAVHTTEEKDKSALIQLIMDAKNVSVFDPTEQLTFAENKIVIFTNKCFDIQRFAILALLLFVFLYGLAALELLQASLNDFTRLRFYGYSSAYLLMIYFSLTFFMALAGELLSFCFLPIAYRIINEAALAKLGFKIALWSENCLSLAFAECFSLLFLPALFMAFASSGKNTIRAMKGISS